MVRTTSSTPLYLALPALVLAAIVLQPAPAQAQMTPWALTALAFRANSS